MKSTVRDGAGGLREGGWGVHEKKRRCGLFLERLWRVGELNTADTCQGFWGCNRGTFRKKGCLANEHRRIRMAGRERMHTKRFWRSSETSRETHFHVFPLYPRASGRASACLRRCGESWERRPAPPSPLRPRAKRLPRVNEPDPERPPSASFLPHDSANLKRQLHREVFK